MKFTTKSCLWIAALMLAFHNSVAFSAEEKGLAKLSYPELEVTPRASERLAIESKSERENRWSTHLPVQISALATLTAGIVVGGDRPANATKEERDNNQWASRTGLIVGAGWLLVTGYMALDYAPYQEGLAEIKGLSTEGERNQLLRERLAEEALMRAARRASRIKWISVATNLLASAYMAGNSGDTGAVVAGISAVLALNPIVFPYHWQRVADQHREYKKKIYGPISQLVPVFKGGDVEFVPTMGLVASF